MERAPFFFAFLLLATRFAMLYGGCIAMILFFGTIWGSSCSPNRLDRRIMALPP
jgi:hypothetical protein